MCGIGGWLAAPGRAVDAAALDALSRAIAHRGPDDLGFLGWRDGAPARTARSADVAAGAALGLAHRRLSILDLTPGGWQPMGTPDGRLQLVFNGEIYDYRERRAELEAQGRRFVSSSDTEVLLAALEAWGAAALPRLTGMFAFALLDTRARTLTLARDPFGIKPLYYARGPFGLVFASEIKALLATGLVRPRADARRFYQYLRFGLTDHTPHTLFDGIAQLPPGHLLELPLDDPAAGTPRAYWSLPDGPALDIGFDDAAARLRALFLESIALHLRSDVPLGAALSGGLDSSAIVGAMRAVGGPSVELHAVSYFAGDPAIDEGSYIELAAGAAAAQVHAARPAPDELASDLDALIATQDEPFGSTSIYAQSRVFRLARERGLTVMLDGQGADELLAGYRPYLATRVLSLVRRGDLAGALGFARRAARLPGMSGGTIAGQLAALLAPAALARAGRRLTGRPLYPDWLDGRWFAARGAGDDFPRRVPGRDALRAQLRLTLGATSLPALLRYEDRNSMAVSIESRVPFLTARLAEFVLVLPEQHLFDATGQGKSVFRAAMRGIVPDAILDRRDKIGFATPERAWLTALDGWVEAALAGDAARAVPGLVAPAALVEWRAMRDGRRPFDFRAWRFVNAVRWTERYGVEHA